jgi:hypothetical protein
VRAEKFIGHGGGELIPLWGTTDPMQRGGVTPCELSTGGGLWGRLVFIIGGQSAKTAVG